jgi:hypothetical protein
MDTGLMLVLEVNACVNRAVDGGPVHQCPLCPRDGGTTTDSGTGGGTSDSGSDATGQ